MAKSRDEDFTLETEFVVTGITGREIPAPRTVKSLDAPRAVKIVVMGVVRENDAMDVRDRPALPAIFLMQTNDGARKRRFAVTRRPGRYADPHDHLALVEIPDVDGGELKEKLVDPGTGPYPLLPRDKASVDFRLHELQQAMAAVMFKLGVPSGPQICKGEVSKAAGTSDDHPPTAPVSL